MATEGRAHWRMSTPKPPAPALSAAPLLACAMFDTPFLDLPPLRGASGTVRLPGSKSISNRVLLLAALAEGSTEVHGAARSDDTQVMLEALRTAGRRLEHAADARAADRRCWAAQLPVPSRPSCSWATPAPRCAR